MVVVQAEHLPSMTAICKKFKKSRNKVKEWHKEGAPIAFDGWKYSAEYNKLQDWILEKYSCQK